MASKCTSCGSVLETGSTFCQNCGTPVTISITPAQAAHLGVMGHIERAVYFRVARVFSWVLLVAAIVGFLYSIALAIGSVGDLWGGKQSVSKEEVQAAIASGQRSNVAQDEESVAENSDPKLIGEYETELAQLVLLVPPEERTQGGGDERIRERFKQIFQQIASGKKEQIASVREARDLLGQFAGKERPQALQHFINLKQQKAQLAVAKQAEAKGKFAYLGGATLMTAMLITLVSMVLVLLAIERSLRTK
jgi:hypothetical protein